MEMLVVAINSLFIRYLLSIYSCQTLLLEVGI